MYLFLFRNVHICNLRLVISRHFHLCEGVICSLVKIIILHENTVEALEDWSIVVDKGLLLFAGAGEPVLVFHGFMREETDSKHCTTWGIFNDSQGRTCWKNIKGLKLCQR